MQLLAPTTISIEQLMEKFSALEVQQLPKETFLSLATPSPITNFLVLTVNR